MSTSNAFDTVRKNVNDLFELQRDFTNLHPIIDELKNIFSTKPTPQTAHLFWKSIVYSNVADIEKTGEIRAVINSPRVKKALVNSHKAQQKRKKESKPKELRLFYLICKLIVISAIVLNEGNNIVDLWISLDCVLSYVRCTLYPSGNRMSQDGFRLLLNPE